MYIAEMKYVFKKTADFTGIRNLLKWWEGILDSSRLDKACDASVFETVHWKGSPFFPCNNLFSM